jgi:ABC-type transport system substrate-binding protein
MIWTRIGAAIIIGGALIGVTGCGGASSTTPRSPSSPPTSASPAPTSTAPTSTAPTSTAPTATPAAAGTRAIRPTEQPDGAGLPRCTTGELSASLGEGGAAAGSVYRPLIFTNTGSHTCELRGFPGVSYVAGDDGHQVGPAAAMSGERGGQVPIPPGGTAQAQLQLVNVQNYDPADCHPVPIRGLRVYPPGDTASLFVPMEGTGCSTTPPGNQLSIQTITP